MTSGGLQVVQFVHPGFEYSGPEYLGPRQERSGVMAPKPGRSVHDRKFLLSTGSAYDWAEGRDHESVAVCFWGEWEGPSVYWRVESPGRPFPSVVHAPFRPPRRPGGSFQNTDPLVFGDAFAYSNCLQHAFPVLRALRPGSLVLFGRHSKAGGHLAFSLDTCLVVEDAETMQPARAGVFGEDLLADMVLEALFTEGTQGDLTVYSGRRPADGAADGPFSFFPARLMPGSSPAFARPELRPDGALADVITPGKMTGIKVTSGLGVSARNAIWEEAVRQVGRQGCMLGYHAAVPPALSPAAAEAVARGPARPVMPA
jgi:hypothetical protein